MAMHGPSPRRSAALARLPLIASVRSVGRYGTVVDGAAAVVGIARPLRRAWRLSCIMALPMTGLLAWPSASEWPTNALCHERRPLPTSLWHWRPPTPQVRQRRRQLPDEL